MSEINYKLKKLKINNLNVFNKFPLAEFFVAWQLHHVATLVPFLFTDLRVNINLVTACRVIFCLAISLPNIYKV